MAPSTRKFFVAVRSAVLVALMLVAVASTAPGQTQSLAELRASGPVREGTDHRTSAARAMAGKAPRHPREHCVFAVSTNVCASFLSLGDHPSQPWGDADAVARVDSRESDESDGICDESA